MNELRRHRHLISLAILAAIAWIGMLALWRSTPYGLGLVNDSATYVEGAANLLAGNGYVRVSGGGEVKPITHFPPLFSLLLAGIGLLGVDFLPGVRILITLLFGVDIVLVGLSVYKVSHSMVFACLGAFLMAVSDLHLGVYSFALSEPLFITFMLAAFLCLHESFDHPQWLWLALSGLFLGMSYLTRFAGASLFVTAVLAIILLNPPRALKRVGIMLAVGLVPIFAWTVYNLITSGLASMGNRQFFWHPVPFLALFEAVKNLLTWIAPDDLLASGPVFGWILSLFSLITLLGLTAWLVWVVIKHLGHAGQKEKPNGSLALAFTHSLHVLVYLGFLVVTLTFFDASTPLNDRILSVIYLPEMILFSSALAWIWNRLGRRMAVLRWGLAGLALLLVIFSAKDGYAAVRQLSREGQGFAHRAISSSPAIQSIRSMPKTIIYSNRPGAIFLLAGKSAYVAPTPQDPVTGQDRANYTADLALMHQRVKAGEAMLVLFGLRNSPDQDELDLFTALTDELTIHADYGEIVIFGASR